MLQLSFLIVLVNAVTAFNYIDIIWLYVGDATILLGKNTMMRKAIRGHLESNPSLEKLLPLIKQNVGFVFTDKELTEIRDKILTNKVPAAARAGALAPVSCTVPAQVTPLGPEKTSFFQALQIPTKISRGNIEILVCVRFTVYVISTV